MFSGRGLNELILRADDSSGLSHCSERGEKRALARRLFHRRETVAESGLEEAGGGNRKV